MPQNTLFSYFAKSPKVESKLDVSANFRENDEKNHNGISKKKEEKQSHPRENNNADYGPMQIVWAKLATYPWWPSIVYEHPVAKIHIRGKGKKTELHVQFFDDPPSRSWVKLSQVKLYRGIKDESAPLTTGDIEWEKAINAADAAIQRSTSDRRDLITCTGSSDDEDQMDINEKADKFYSSTDMMTPARKKLKLDKDLSDLESSGDEDCYKPTKHESESDSGSSGIDEDLVSEPDSEEPVVSPVKTKKRKRPSKIEKNKNITPKHTIGPLSTPKSNVSSFFVTPSPKQTTPINSHTKARLSLFSASPSCNRSENGNSAEGKVWNHLKFDWLKDGNKKDKEKRGQDHPDYDPRTLHVPESMKKNFTPAMRQWWDLKVDHFDTILFFKVGKFYELYNQDAVVAVNELGLLYMRGEYAHAGFPEISFSRYSDMLIEKGYKVARIEQTETPAMMEQRVKKLKHVTKYDKVVKREICRVMSKGARTCSFIDGNVHNHSSNYLLAVKEKVIEGSASNEVQFGVTFVDTTIGKFHIGQFNDDRHRSRFRTLISHHPPAQILVERGNLSLQTLQIINNNLMSVMRETLAPNSEFWTSKKTLTFISESRYFSDNESCKKSCYPTALSAVLDAGDVLNLTVLPNKDLAVQSLGACVWYLQKCLMDHELLSMKSFEEFNPVDCHPKDLSDTFHQQHLVLDGITLKNLDVIENGSTGTQDGTLLQRLDNCTTPFGKRLVNQWLCSPLCNPSAINDRLNALEDLMSVPEIVSEVYDLMKKLPDLERLLSKIHSQGSSIKQKNHPDGRAIFFDDAIYSKRKITDFLSALEGFKTSLEIVKMFSSCKTKLRSELLRKCVMNSKDQGNFPEIQEHLHFFDNSFDHDQALKDGKIIPAKGVDKDYDEAMAAIRKLEKSLNSHLDEQRKKLHCKITYFGTGKNRFQLEIPENSLRHLSDEFELQSQRKGFKRYWTPFIKDAFADIVAAEDRRDVALKDIMRKIFQQFDSHYEEWLCAVQCLSVLDVLINLSNFSKSSNMCRPEILSSNSQEKPFIEIRDGVHPCISSSYASDEFIPNDVLIGVKNAASPSIVIVTGPNMGGKSTLMRQAGLQIILAQLGCYVPASKCVLSPVDRIFTRLGASDKIMAGQSTFFVELNETSSILQHATSRSLVLMDELGRGTATYDGTSIACAVVQELAQNIQCRTLFSTHYHSLVESFSRDPNIRLGHMACMVENESDEDPSQETITFLYKFIEGACPKSYGFNAARLAGLPETVIKEGHAKAIEFEKLLESKKMFRKLIESC